MAHNTFLNTPLAQTGKGDNTIMQPDYQLSTPPVHPNLRQPPTGRTNYKTTPVTSKGEHIPTQQSEVTLCEDNPIAKTGGIRQPMTSTPKQPTMQQQQMFTGVSQAATDVTNTGQTTQPSSIVGSQPTSLVSGQYGAVVGSPNAVQVQQQVGNIPNQYSSNPTACQLPMSLTGNQAAATPNYTASH